MTAKEYVSQLIGINARIREVEVTLSALRHEKDTLRATRYDSERVSGGVPGDLSDVIIRIQDDIIRYYERLKHLRALKNSVEMTVSQIRDGRHATLLILRYEHRCTWGYIADALSTSHNIVNADTARLKMHKRALEDLDELLSRSESNGTFVSNMR
jgi:hypothetical protein|nr:MAG TPA: Protein of unknown function (DUF1492) [Caudoviricetes sp.]DAS19685.1 MAG TPA: Protein of unknown function (DUF1492) [Caudoviricetes sp.]